MTWSTRKLMATGVLALGLTGIGVGVAGTFNRSADPATLREAIRTCHIKEAHQLPCTDAENAAKKSVRMMGGGAAALLLLGGYKKSQP